MPRLAPAGSFSINTSMSVWGPCWKYGFSFFLKNMDQSLVPLPILFCQTLQTCCSVCEKFEKHFGSVPYNPAVWHLPWVQLWLCLSCTRSWLPSEISVSDAIQQAQQIHRAGEGPFLPAEHPETRIWEPPCPRALGHTFWVQGRKHQVSYQQTESTGGLHSKSFKSFNQLSIW